MQKDPNTPSFGRGRCPAGRAGRHQRWQFPAPLHDVGHGGSERRGDETDGTGRDDEGRVCGPGWRARRGAESRECRGEATHDGGQDVSHDVTGKGNQKQSRAGAGRLPCNHTNGALSFFFHASDAAQDPNSAPHVQVLCRRAVS